MSKFTLVIADQTLLIYCTGLRISTKLLKPKVLKPRFPVGVPRHSEVPFTTVRGATN